jgi:hypothetical protein
MRIAQRAFRLRQETEMSTLRDRVMKLDDWVNQLSQLYIQFRKDVITSGLSNNHPELVAQLKESTEKILLVARQGNDESKRENIQEIIKIRYLVISLAEI